MKKVYLFAWLCICISFFSVKIVFSNEEIMTVAISEFKTQGDDASLDWLGSSCADALISRISSDRSVRIVEREYLNKIIEELKLQMGGLVDENTAVEVGRLIGVQYFVFGSATKFNDNLVLSTRTVNVETAEIVGSNRVNGNINDIFNLQEELARKISADLTLNSVIFAADDVDYSAISFDVYSKIERLKIMAKDIPLFALDPARRRKTGEYQMALMICEDLIRLHPKLYLAHYYRGIFSLQSDDYATADNASKTAKALNPNDIEVLLLRATYFFIKKDYVKAKGALQYISIEYPNEARAWYGLGKVYMKQMDDYSAMEAFINSIASDVLIPKALTSLRTLVAGPNEPGKAQFTNEKYYYAAKLFRVFWTPGQKLNNDVYEMAKQAKLAFNNLYISYYMMGYFESAQKKYEMSEINFQRCIKLRPTFPEAHRELGLVYFNTRQCYQANQHVTLYLKTANAVDDYERIERAKRNCY